MAMVINAFQKVNFNSNCRTLEHDNHVVLGNILNGLWIKCPSYVYDFMNNCIQKEYSVSEILSECQDQETKVYMEKLLSTLKNIEVINYDTERMTVNQEIKHVTIELTTGCNLKCSHCCVNCGDIPREDMSLETLKELIDWCENSGVSGIALTGGEIFIRKDIWDILNYVRTKFTGQIEVMTNGTLIKKSMIQTLRTLVDNVSISLDGYDEHSVTKIRGAGVLGKVESTINNLKEVGFKSISLSMVLTKETITHKDKFEGLCLSLDVKSVTRVFTPEGRAESNYEMLSPPFKMRVKDDFSESEWNDLQNAASFKCACNLDTKILVCWNGDIYPCFLTKNENNHLGNISDLIDGNFKKIQLTPIVDEIEPCQQCNVKYFCASACPGHDSNIFLNEEYRSAMCTQMKDYYTKVVWQ
ncbi:hypothetical protein BVG16_00345 [Paenibacillus selenitireducens]|uniref:Radical SAM core domain-containing protein n=1 Tax=Paenibacillus selenitireducens TaxID=1324314 RepID=A0A1T2XLT1_9BACL|nr:radical SAM protein [Paenibacillus selenitireducens]OPA80840.1 hypothetical protein BVG16_00345 [Paenibacillus selenitireducens]